MAKKIVISRINTRCRTLKSKRDCLESNIKYWS